VSTINISRLLPLLIIGSICLLCQIVYWVTYARQTYNASLNFPSSRNLSILGEYSEASHSRSAQHLLNFKPDPQRHGLLRCGVNVNGWFRKRFWVVTFEGIRGVELDGDMQPTGARSRAIAEVVSGEIFLVIDAALVSVRCWGLSASYVWVEAFHFSAVCA
jgi:hypothetical protein